MTELQKLERRLRNIYSKSWNGIKGEWKNYLASADSELAELRKALGVAKGKGDTYAINKAKRDLAKALQKKVMMTKRFTELTEQTAETLRLTHQTALDYINDSLPKRYAFGYNEILKSGEIPIKRSFSVINQNTVKNLVMKDKLRLPYATVKVAKEEAYIRKRINSQLLQGINAGESVDKIGKRLQKVAYSDANAAVRNARTMITSAENEGRLDSYRTAEKMGIIVKKVWLAVSDSRTRDSHAAMDGEEVDVDEPFSNGLMYPGDETGDPEEVYNCRCTMVTRVIGFR